MQTKRFPFDLEIIEKVLQRIEKGECGNFEVVGGDSFNPQVNSLVVLPLGHPHGLYVLHSKTKERLYFERLISDNFQI